MVALSCEFRPELGPATELFVSILGAAHTLGNPNQPIAFDRFAAIFPNLTDDEREGLQRRTLHVTPRGEREGTFVNAGPAMEMVLGGLPVQLLEKIEGKYLSYPDEAVLIFEDSLGSNTFKLGHSDRVQRIQISRRRISLDVSGATSDRCFDLELGNR